MYPELWLRVLYHASSPLIMVELTIHPGVDYKSHCQEGYDVQMNHKHGNPVIFHSKRLEDFLFSIVICHKK